MKEFLLTTPAQVVIWTSVLLLICAIGAFLVGRFRGSTDDDRQSANDLLTNFREMFQQGDIDESEFRDIKTVLAPKLRQEIKGTDDKG